MSNAYDSTRGNATDRQRRRDWLLKTYAADKRLYIADGMTMPVTPENAYYDIAEPACRCYRCGKLLTIDTLTVDRIIPGCQGGTYRRNNIRPACKTCNEKTGGKIGGKRSARNRLPVVRPGVPQLAARNAPAGRDDEGPVPVPDV